LDLCRRLKVFKCSRNRLGACPEALGNCYKLELVDLSHNNISKPIPGAAVRLLLGLTELDLR
jgi:Leucine-rich repeat (LRR) protein